MGVKTPVFMENSEKPEKNKASRTKSAACFKKKKRKNRSMDGYGRKEWGFHTTVARGGTGEEKTICVLVFPNFCSCPIKLSSSCVEPKDTLTSIE